ncbi:hypothetical protein [Parafilimonas sp.]|uniref:hypothetical protein n=1 Tax=Parafilimonas sp. TaxID=1969739 RepID=UPI0039E4652B
MIVVTTIYLFHFFPVTNNSQTSIPNTLAIFANYHPCDFVEDLREWQTLAMINEQSVYNEANAREDLLDFTAALMKLAEALWIVCDARCSTAKIKTPWPAGDVQLQVLNEKERDRPHKVIRHCCSTFTQQYAQTELLDLLDAVVTYEGSRKIYKGSLILMYLHLEYLVKAAYTICPLQSLL